MKTYRKVWKRNMETLLEILLNVTDHAWYRFLFSKIQISFNNYKNRVCIYFYGPNDFGGLLPIILSRPPKNTSLNRGIVHSLNSGKVAATRPILKSVLSKFFYSLNYSFAACLKDNSGPKVETRRKLSQFTVPGWLIMNGFREWSQDGQT